MDKLQSRYVASRTRLGERAAVAGAKAGVDASQEAIRVAERFGVSRKKRAVSEYNGVASCLLSEYPPEVAYFVAVELNEQCESRLGYPPIGQIMLAMENIGTEEAARWIVCALRNFPRIETAQLAFGVIKSPTMRSLVYADLAAEDPELAKYISSGEMATPRTNLRSSTREGIAQSTAKHVSHLSDGVEQMPRRLTVAERRGDRLFLHLQIVSFLLLFVCPIVGGVLTSWRGAAIGLVLGFLVRIWMRHSMGLRGSEPTEGFIMRMRERANGARLGFLESLIERVRRRPFSQTKCLAIISVWDETQQRLAMTTTQEEKQALIDALDARIKHISYGEDS